MNSVPFWWLVRRVVAGKAGYYDAANTAWFAHQAWGEPFLSREDAEETAKSTGEPSARAVRVHARIPEPKLPAWVTALSFQYQHVQVWRREGGRWTQCVFAVSGNGLRITETITHAPAGIHRPQTLWPHVPHDVWAEAAQRAAKMLRARKAGK